MKKIVYLNGKETNYEVSDDGKVFNRKTKKELKGTLTRNEYKTVQLTIDGKVKSIMVHRLVAEAFCDNPNNYSLVDHIDRNKHNNNAKNLRWANEYMNIQNRDWSNSKGKKAIFLQKIDNNWIDSLEEGYMVNKDGQILNKNTKRLIQGSLRNGYRRITTKTGRKSVHLLVWEAFNGKIPNGMIIDHIDGNRDNNKLENLRLITHSENMRHVYENGGGIQIGISQYNKDGIFIAKYKSIREASKAVNGNEFAIKDAAKRYGTSSGYFWIREDQDISIEEVLKITPTNKPKKTSLGVTQYDLKGNKINHFNSLREAARALGCADSTIQRAALNKRVGKKYYWILDKQDFTIEDLINSENFLIAG